MTPQKSNSRSLIRLIGIGIAYLLLFAVLDLFFTYAYEQTGTDLYIEHNVYHHGFEPMSHQRKSFRGRTYDIISNSLGFKDNRSREIPLTTEKERIVFLGDSFTEGVGLPYGETFVGIIDSMLRGDSVEVLNAGVQSYSPIIYWKKITHLLNLGIEFDRLVLFLDISDVYDEANRYQLSRDSARVERRDPDTALYKQGWLVGLKQWVERRTTGTYFLLNFFHDLVVDRTDDNKWRRIIQMPSSRWTVDKMAFEEWGEFGLSNMDHYMSKLYDQLSKHRIQLTVTVYPWPTQIWHGDRSSIHVEYWRDWCNARGVDFIDIFPELIPSDASAEDKLAVLNEFYLPYDMHFNARGNRLIAERFIEYYFKQFD